VAWIDTRYFGDDLQRERLHVTSRRGHSFTAARSPICNLDCLVIGFGPQIDGGSLYWAYEFLCGCGGLNGMHSTRLTRHGQQWCRSAGPGFGVREWGEYFILDFAVARGRIFYAENRGLFEIDPGRIHWGRTRCRGNTSADR
jgi:hypothetical protein